MLGTVYTGVVFIQCAAVMVNEPAFILALSSFTERFKLDGFFWYGNLILWSNLNSECILLYIGWVE